MKKFLVVLFAYFGIQGAFAQNFYDIIHSNKDIAGVEKSYERASLFIPGEFGRSNFNEIDQTKKYPVVIYLHGCAGLTGHDYHWGKFISDLGYIVIQPNTLSRPNTRSVCDSQNHTHERGAPLRDALMFRQQEIRYAYEQVVKSPWADVNNIFLMGHSQGGVAVGMNRINNFKGMIISGWTCNNKWTGGISARKDMPVLAMGWDRDPWYYGTDLNGRCVDNARDHKNFTQLDLAGPGHSTSQSKDARIAVSKFLQENTY